MNCFPRGIKIKIFLSQIIKQIREKEMYINRRNKEIKYNSLRRIEIKIILLSKIIWEIKRSIGTNNEVNENEIKILSLEKIIDSRRDEKLQAMR